MIWYKLSFIIGFLITASIGIVVFLYHPRKRTNQYWGLLCLSVSLWNFGRLMRLIAATNTDYESGLFWCRLMYIGAILIPVFFYLFILGLLEKPFRYKILLFSPALFFLSIVFSNLMIKDIVLQFSSLYYPVPGPFYPFFLIYFLSFAATAHYHLYASFKTSSGYKKNQIRYVSLASIIGFLSGLTTFPLVFNIPFPPIGAPLVSLYTLITAYAIVKYRLMDIKIIIKKTITYSFLVFLIIIPCFLLIINSMKHLEHLDRPDIWFSILVLSTMLFLSFTVTKIKDKMERTIEQKLFPSRYDYLQTLKHISQDIGAISNLQELLRKLSVILHSIFGLSKSSFLLFDSKKKVFTVTYSQGVEKADIENLSLKADDRLFSWFGENDKILILEELEQSPKHSEYLEIIYTMHSLESEICIPLFFQKHLAGIINLGSKESGEMFSNEELKFLSTLANQVAVAIENSKLYSRMLRTDRLAAVGTLAARLAHEIRNPLVSIKTVTELLPERIDDPEFRTHFLGIAINEIDRIKQLVDDMLNFSKPYAPKFQNEDVNQIIHDMLHLLQSETRSKNLTVNYDPDENLPPIKLDKDQIKQVILNIMLNAVHACNENNTIYISTRLIDIDHNSQNLQIEIRDNGVGIQEKDLENLFDPFFSTKHDGVGLGLSIAHQIVQEHDGLLEVDSEFGRGTSFYINIPARDTNGKDSTL